MPLIKSVSGVRGIVDPRCGQRVTLDAEVACDLGRAFATYLRRRRRSGTESDPALLGSRDGRPGGGPFLEAFARGAWECGTRVIPLGIVTTPGTGLAVAENRETLGVCGGVVITASHNPQQWNGLKLLLDAGRAPTAHWRGVHPGPGGQTRLRHPPRAGRRQPVHLADHRRPGCRRRRRLRRAPISRG